MRSRQRERATGTRSDECGVRFGKNRARFARHSASMAICIGHTSALELWRAARLGRCAFPIASSASFPASLSGVEARALLRPFVRAGILKVPVHVIVATQNARHKVNGIAAHSMDAACASGQLCKIAEGMYVLSPLASLLHSSASMSVEQSAMLGFEMCGSYAVDGQVKAGFSQASAIASSVEMAAFLNTAFGGRFARSTRRVASLVLDGAASPAEAQLACRLCFPKTRGGYGLPKPAMNCRVEVRGEARKMTQKRFFVCDLLWKEAGLDVEYDSAMFHASAGGLASDAERRNALQAMGLAVITVTGGHMADLASFDDAARSIAHALDVRLRTSSSDWLQRRRTLAYALSRCQI